MANRPQRTPEQQEYRDNLAHDIKTLRQYGDTGRRLASVLLEKEQTSPKYYESLGNGRKVKNDRLNKLIHDGNIEIIIKNIDKFYPKKRVIALYLIEQGYGQEVAKNMEKFNGLNVECANLLIGQGYGQEVAKNMEKFDGLNVECANLLIEQGYGQEVLENIEKFRGLDKNFRHLLIEKLDLYKVSENIDYFLGKIPNEYHWDIAEKLMDEGYGEIVINNLEKFNFPGKGLKGSLYEEKRGLLWFDRYVPGDHEYLIMVAKNMIDKGCENIIAENINKFEVLDTSVAESLIRAGYGDIVAKYPEKFLLKKEK